LSKKKVFAGVSLLIVVSLCLALTAYTVKSAKERYNKQRVIFAMNDPKGDDHGPGSYKYPIDSIFDPKKEHFDLQRFSFAALRNNYYFDMTFARVTNPWGAAEGFSHTMIQIYISDDPDNGRIEPFREGANVLFDPENPWKYLLKVVSFNKTAVYWASDYEGSEGRSKGVQAKLQPDKKTVRVTVPKSLLPGDPYKWRYYVLVGSQDGSGPDNFRPVNAATGQWTFGGGTDTDYNPNVIDLLAPPGKQEKMLGSYSVAKRVQAVIEPVGPSPVIPTRWDKILDKSIDYLLRMKVKL